MTIGKVVVRIIGVALLLVVGFYTWQFVRGFTSTFPLQQTVSNVADAVQSTGVQAGETTAETVASRQEIVVEDNFWATGPAPQTASQASQVLGVGIDFLTPLNARAGDPMVIGWVVGKPPYNDRFTAKLYSGICVDYIRSSGTITGLTEWNVAYQTADWNRALMDGEGNTSGVKATVYWSVCNKADGGEFTNVVPSGSTGQNLPTPTVTSVPTATAVNTPDANPTAATQANKTCNEPPIPATWVRLGQNEGPCAWKTDQVNLNNWAVPTGAAVDIDNPVSHRVAGNILESYKGPMTFRWEQ